MMVREALRAFASPDVVRRIEQRALALAELPEVPRGGSSLRTFIELHLSTAATSALGQDVSDALLATLGPITHRIPSEIPRRLTPRPAPLGLGADIHERTTSTPDASQTVLLASLDPARVSELEEALGEVNLVVIQDIVALLDILQANRSLAPVIVVDCSDPAVQPATLATVAPEFAPGTEVVLWSSGAATGDDWMLADRTATWVRCPAGAAIDQVAKAIHALLAR